MNLELVDGILESYAKLVKSKYPGSSSNWPVTTGFKYQSYFFGDWEFILLSHTGISIATSGATLGERPISTLGVTSITFENLKDIKDKFLNMFAHGPKDTVLVLYLGKKPDGKLYYDLSRIEDEIEYMLTRHEVVMGVAPMKIFLSHRSTLDGDSVEQFSDTLETLGFTTWFDRKDANAGDDRNEVFFEGMDQSCAAVFFVTKNFRFEGDLKAEINYALELKRKRKEKFSLIFIRFEGGEVSDMLKSLVIYKDANNDLEALRYIVKSLPIKLGPTHFR
jgi:TIR domain.